jgi:hypothetical protein
MVTMLFWFGISMLVGIYAQRGRGRKSPIWWILTAIIYAGVWILIQVTGVAEHLDLASVYGNGSDTELTAALAAALVAGVVMVTVVSVLPRQKRL